MTEASWSTPPELSSLLDRIEALTGIDYTSHDPFVIERRIRAYLSRTGLEGMDVLEQQLGSSPAGIEQLLIALAPPVGALFEPPAFWLVLRRDVVPLLRTYPHFLIWIPGCADGAAAYATAIVLREEGLSERALIYATDVAEAVLARARAGHLPREAVRLSAQQYGTAGGRARFEEYYVDDPRTGATLRPLLRDRIVFAQHNLATEASLNEFHLILCDARTLTDLRPSLEVRVHRLLAGSLCRFGILALPGPQELPESMQALYRPFDRSNGLYRRSC